MVVDTHQGTGGTFVVEKTRQDADEGRPAKLRQAAISLQEKPGSVVVQGSVEGEHNSIMSFNRRH